MQLVKRCLPWALALVALLSLFLNESIRPAVQGVTILIDGQTSDNGLPVYYQVQNTKAVATIRLTLARLHATRFQLIPDDCIDDVFVNGEKVEQHGHFCDWRNGRDYDLGSHLREGENSVEVHLYNKKGQGSLEFNLANSDPLLMLSRALLLTSFCALALLIFQRSQRSLAADSLTRGIFNIWLCGVVIRVIYFYATPFWVRAYDWNGHTGYLNHVLQNFSLPTYNSGWQAYQPPLYYFTIASLMSALQGIGLTLPSVTRFSEYVALLLSFGTLALELGCVTILFRGGRFRWGAFFLAGWLATLPALVMFSTRVSNDVLYYFLGAATLYVLLSWWQRKENKKWYIAVILCALSMLTKSNGINLVAVTFSLLLLNGELSLRSRAKMLVLGSGLLFLICGWYYALRFLEEGQPSLVGNIQSNPNGLRVDNSLESFITFNPLEVLATPYNHTWDDRFRRKNFWEFLYRSLFFGEFRLGEPKKFFASFLLLLGYGVLILAGRGFYSELRARSRWFWPMSLTLVLMVGSLLAVRIQHNISGFADFRYIPLAALPLGYFAARGVEKLWPRTRRWAQLTLGTLILCCAYFSMAFYFVDPR